MTIVTEQGLQDPIYTAIATMVLTEIGKRLPNKWIPLKAERTNDIKLVAGGLALVIAAVRLYSEGQINMTDAWGSAVTLVRTWLMGWLFAHAAYNAAPFLKDEKKTEVTP